MLTFYISLIETESDKRRFEEVYHTYKKQMGYLAKSLLSNQQDAEDVVHDVFCKIASSRLSVITTAKNEADVRNYLLKSVKNACISMQRKKNIRADYTNEKHGIKNELSDSEFLDTVCREIEYDGFLQILTSLDEKYREVLYYHLVVGMSIKETAETVGKPPNTVKQQLARAKRIVANLLSERDEE